MGKTRRYGDDQPGERAASAWTREDGEIEVEAVDIPPLPASTFEILSRDCAAFALARGCTLLPGSNRDTWVFDNAGDQAHDAWWLFYHGVPLINARVLCQAQRTIRDILRDGVTTKPVTLAGRIQDDGHGRAA